MSALLARRATFGRGRRMAILANVVAMVVLSIVAAGILVYVTGFTGAKARIDLTRTASYTLSPESETILAGLEQPVEIITVFDHQTFYWDRDQVRLKAMDYVVDLLQEYKVRSGGKLTVENLIPQRDNARVADLFQKYEIGSYSVVIVVGPGGQRRVLGLETDLAEFDTGIDPGSRAPVRPWKLLSYRAEEALTGAIVEVTQGKAPTVYVMNGHGEYALSDPRDTGAMMLGGNLRQDNMNVEPLALFVTRTVPQDAAAVFLLGPTEPFADFERAALEDYLRRGGRLFVAIDPLGDRSLDELWRALGIELERNVVCFDQGGTLKGVGASEIYIGRGAPGSYGAHVIVETMRAEDEVLILSRSGGIKPVTGTEAAYSCLFSSYPEAWGDIPKDDKTPGDYRLDPRQEVKGQRCLGAAIEPTAGPFAGARVVFVASDRLVTNAALAAGAAGNRTFIRRTANWLVGRRKTIDLLPRRIDASVTDLRPDEYDSIFLFLVVYLPLGGLALTALVWFARRR